MDHERPPGSTSFHVRGAVGGDPESIEWIVAHFDPFVEAQVRMRLDTAAPRGVELRDLVDDVWLATLRSLGRLRPRNERLTPVLLTFVTTTALNVCNNHLRATIRRRAREGPAPARAANGGGDLDALPSSSRGVLTSTSSNEIRDAVSGALAALPADKVEILVLKLLERRRNVEIAEILGIPANTVAVRYRRALSDLRAKLDRLAFREILKLSREAPVRDGELR